MKQEAEQEHTKETLPFSKAFSSIIVKNLDDVLRSRAVFILLEYIEHPLTAKIILPEIKHKKKEIAKIAAELPKAKGL